MNKQIKVLITGSILLVIGILIFSNWGKPESELEKTNVEELKSKDFSSILNTTWTNNKTDPTSAEISFDIEGLKNTKGFFKDFDITFKVSENDPQKAKLKVSINVNSINTDNDIRDKELMGIDFFNTEKYPTIDFYSKEIINMDTSFTTNGTLQMMGEIQPLSFIFKYSGIADNKMGTKVAIFEGKLIIDRTKFGMKPVTSVGNDVQIKFYCELIKN
jgi:polyisoprenoid-binding protein YceI